MEATTTLDRRVRVIPATKTQGAIHSTYDGKKRVAAYCRVSTDSEEQLNSYEAQKSYYTQKIEDSPDWEMAGIYADEGISGTSMKKRTEFKKMITACKRGHIDLIITKSLSRFARNTVDCLETVRLLKANGIGVYFEKENINTLTESSEFLITLFSGFAQAESESLSKNVAWGKAKSAEAGKVTFQYKKMLGYRRGADGQPEIVPEEAEVIKRIYHRYLDGCTLGQIKRELDADKVPTAQGVDSWSPAIIHNILTNEKYIGDALLQKTYITDCISKKVKKNQGERAMYYVENNHPAIISREVFDQVRNEMTRRSSKRKVLQKSGKTELGKYSGKYALTELLVCGECGSPYKRVTWARNGKKRIVWRCVSRLEFGTKYCHNSPTLDESNDFLLSVLNLGLQLLAGFLSWLCHGWSLLSARRHRKRTVDFLGCPLWYILFWCQLLVNEYFFSIDDRRYNFYNFFGFHLFCDYLIFDTVIFKFSHIHIIVARRFVRVRVIRTTGHGTIPKGNCRSVNVRSFHFIFGQKINTIT